MAKKKSTPKPSLSDYTTPMSNGILSSMSPKHALARLKQGNARFMAAVGTNEPRNRQKGGKNNRFIKASNTKKGQNPFAIVLSCVDSRIPTEVILDQEIGDMFNARIAGNFVNEDILGSMEFAAGYVKLIVVMGHTACGAVSAACDVIYPINSAKSSSSTDDSLPQPNNLPQLVEKLTPAVASTPLTIDRRQFRKAQKGSLVRNNFINSAAITNVRKTMGDILTQSTFLRNQIVKGQIMLVGAMYDVDTGLVTFLDQPSDEAV